MRLRITFELVPEQRDEKKLVPVYIQGTVRHFGHGDYFALRSDHLARWSIELTNAEKIKQLDAWLQPV